MARPSECYCLDIATWNMNKSRVARVLEHMVGRPEILLLQECQCPKDRDFMVHSQYYIFMPRLPKTEACVAIAARTDIAQTGRPNANRSSILSS